MSQTALRKGLRIYAAPSPAQPDRIPINPTLNQRSKKLGPKGARGLMQLMPGTARRFAVRNSFDLAENVRGGTQYLRELLTMFNGRVDLALASYNAGEGRVINYGNKVPPFQETQNYVKRIGQRYKKSGSSQKDAHKAPAARVAQPALAKETP